MKRLCECPHPALVVTVCHQGDGPNGFVVERRRHHCRGRRTVSMSEVERRAVWVWAGACAVGLSVASSFWKDLTVGTSHSGHR